MQIYRVVSAIANWYGASVRLGVTISCLFPKLFTRKLARQRERYEWQTPLEAGHETRLLGLPGFIHTGVAADNFLTAKIHNWRATHEIKAQLQTK